MGSDVTAAGVLGAAVVWYLGVNFIAGACVSAVKASASSRDWCHRQTVTWCFGTVASFTASTALARVWPLPLAAAAGAAGAWASVPFATYVVPMLTPTPADSPPPS